MLYLGKAFTALSTAVLTALLVKEIKAISFGLTPFFKCRLSTLSISVWVLPVPGGPKILIVLWYRLFRFFSSEFSGMEFIV